MQESFVKATDDYVHYDVSDWFWDIIQEVRGNESKLYLILAKMSKEEIYRFEDEFLSAWADLRDPRFEIYFDASEDGTDDIIYWIVGQGKDYYFMTWKEPELILECLKGGSWADLFSNNLFGVAYEVYEGKFGESLNIIN